MKCLKLKIGEIDDTRAWYRLADRCKQLTNRVWQLWLIHHVQSDSATAIRDHLQSLDRWRKADSKSRGDKPKLAVTCFSTELANTIYHDCRKNFPDLNCRTLVLLLNILRGRIIKRKAAKGKLSGWMAILLGHESLPSSTKPVPIPFDKQNAKIWSEGEGRIKCLVRLERTEETGKSVEWVFDLETTGKIARYAKPIHDVASGQAPLKGCSIFYDSFKRQWFALIAYEPVEEPKPEVDESNVLILRPGRCRPWVVRVGGKSFYLGGDGRSVTHHRRRILLSRWGRQENYRWTATATKGHGRNRAMAGFFKLKQSWNNFAKTYNQQVAAKVITICCERGVGKIVLSLRCHRRFLETSGKIPDRRDATAWPWYQFSKILLDLAHTLNIAVEVFQGGEREKALAGNGLGGVSRES